MLRLATRLVPLVLMGVLLARMIPAWPDDWDGLAFLAAIDHFDLDKFAPHPPGYPVYVALLKVASYAIRDRVLAAGAVSVASALATIALAQSAAARARDEVTGLFVGASIIVAPLTFRAASGVGSEACALAFAALAAWAIVRKNPWIVGIAIGLGLGVRLSWAPFYASLFFLSPPGTRLRALAGAAAGTLAWLVPFAAIVGPSHLVALERAHVVGHATQWGGTVVTEPGFVRVVWLFRSIFVDGVGCGPDILGSVLATLLAIVLLVVLTTWRRMRFRNARAAAILVIPYATYVLLFQNIHAQPRHALPLVAVFVAAVAFMATAPKRVRRFGVVLLALVAFRSARDASMRHDIPPAGAQIVDWMASQEERSFLFANASARFFEGTPLAARVKLAGGLGDIDVALTRMDDPPPVVYFTSELRGLETESPPPSPVAVFCRPERIDRRAPCVTVYRLR
jgi:hypothetical protein